jgi:hypothetical protein
MIQKLLILSISIYLLGCATTGTVISPCGNGYVFHNNLCWTTKSGNGNAQKAMNDCKSINHRLPMLQELEAFCQANRGLPNYDRPGADATLYWSGTQDQTANSNVWTVSPSCRRNSSVYLNNKFYFCVKEYVQPTTN